MPHSQTEMIKAALLNGESLTPLDALERFGCFRLAAQICTLKKQGLAIKTTIIWEGCKHYASYKLIV